MKRIAIIGSAHLGQQIAHHIHTDTEDKVVAFFDDYQPKGTIIDSIPVIGGTNDILDEYSKNSFDELLIKIKTKTYGIVLVDENTKDFNYKELIKIVSETRQSKMINTKLLIFGTKERVDLPFVKMLAENISKAELAATVRAQLDTTTDDKTKDSYEFIKFSS